MNRLRKYILEYMGEKDPFRGSSSLEFWGPVNNIQMTIRTPRGEQEIKLKDFLKDRNNLKTLYSLLQQAELIKGHRIPASARVLAADLYFTIHDYFSKLKQPADIIAKKDFLIQFNPE